MFLRRTRGWFALFLLSTSLSALADQPTQRLGVTAPAQIIRDQEGIPHIFASAEIDLIYLQGYVHACDRLFQMDTLRRQADGTLAELLGQAAVSGDVMFRTIGLRRAAERSLPLASPHVRAAFAAYARGVNDYVQANALPPEYAALEITRFRPWTEVDSIALLKFAVFPPFEEIERTLRLQSYQAAGLANGFDGTALYFNDTNRAQPFDDAATVPDALAAPVRRPPQRWNRNTAQLDTSHLDATTLRLAREFLQRLR